MGRIKRLCIRLIRKFESPQAKSERQHKSFRDQWRIEFLRLEELGQKSIPLPPPKLRRGLSMGRADVQALGEPRIPGKRKTDMQLDSCFFKLPAEIRSAIYEELVGGYMIKVAFRSLVRKMEHSRYIFCGELWRFAGNQELSLAKECGWIAILKVCRRVYCEAIEILYMKNGFYFSTLKDVMRLSVVLPPGRMQWIRNVAWVDHSKTYCVAWDRGQSRRNTPPWRVCLGSEECRCTECLPDDTCTSISARIEIIRQWRENEEINPPGETKVWQQSFSRKCHVPEHHRIDYHAMRAARRNHNYI